MTSKLPVVGKRYKHKEDSFKIKIKSIELLRNDYFVFPEEKMSGWKLDEFLKNFEELPDSNPQEEPKQYWELIDTKKQHQEKSSGRIVEIRALSTAEILYRFLDKEYERGEFEKFPTYDFSRYFTEVNETANPVDLEKGEVSEKFYCKTCLNDTSEDIPCRQHSKDICCACHDRKCDERIEDYNKVSEVERALEELKEDRAEPVDTTITVQYETNGRVMTPYEQIEEILEQIQKDIEELKRKASD